MQASGVIIRQSQYSVKESIDMLQKVLVSRGATIYKRINQQDEVNSAGLPLFPLEFILFGNPRVGGVLMAENPLIALDLPLKVIAWQDANNNVWVAYNTGTYIEERYSLKHNPASFLDIDKMMEDQFGWCDC